MRSILISIFLLSLAAYPQNQVNPMNSLAEQYVKLVLAVGEHDPDYVDAYYGPAAWREAAKSERQSLAGIRNSAASAIAEISKLRPGDAKAENRRHFLLRQLQALAARVEMLDGRKYRFDEEANALYDATPPKYPESHFAEILRQLDSLLPGSGSVASRYEEYKKGFVIAPDRLDAVFTVAIKEARKRTRAKIPLPSEESFKVEYVKNQPWSGYNWYKGNYHSLIQVNTDLPMFIDRAVDLACHEGYPGHHVYNVLLEKNLLRKNHWIEFSVYPLFSPESLIAEGSANYGIEVAFPGKERVEWERSVLFPIAGLDPSGAAKYYEISELVAKLNYAGNEAARHYLDGDWKAEAALAWLQKYALMEPKRAEQRLRFIEKYRSYVINYNLGLDMVRAHVDTLGGTASHPAQRWKVFTALLSSPLLPSELNR